MITSIIRNRFLKNILIFIFWISIWEICATVIDREIYLPSVTSVVKVLSNILSESDTYITILYSSYRTLIGVVLSCIFGIMLGVLAGLVGIVRDVLNPFIVVIRSTPVVTFIILAILWLESTNVPILASFLMCFPVVYTNVVTGIKNTDKKLLEMCKIYKLDNFTILKSVYLYSVFPYLYSAIISSIGIAWKASAAAEVLSLPEFSLGSHLFFSKTYLDPASLFAWTLIIIAMSYLFEVVFKKVFRHDKTK